MEKVVIKVTAENCTGCLRCQLACSEVYGKVFNPATSRIRVERFEFDSSIEFTEECNQCGICVEHCFYDVLQKSQGKEKA